MNKLIKLSSAVTYNNNRIKSDKISLENFVTTDNILQNKAGITLATNLPPQGSTMPAFKTNNILVANIRPYLKKIWFANRNGGCSADVLVFDVKKDFYPKYVYYSMYRDDFFSHMMRGSKGTKMPRGDKNQILDFLLPNYDIHTQQKIASVLSSLDSKIELNNRINNELEAMAKILYDYWFVQFDFPDANGKPYKTNGGKMVWNKELKKEIPEGWASKNLNYFGDFKNGINYDPSIAGDTIANIINVRNISSSSLFIQKSTLDQICLQGDNVQKYLVSNDDILIARSGIPGATRLMFEYNENTIYCGFIIRFRVSNPVYKNYLFFSIKNIEKASTAKSAGTIMQNINQESLNRLIVIDPKDHLIDKFNEFISPIFNKMNNINNENQQLSSLRDWLLPMLMNGQVKVKDTVEETLLIAAEEKVKYHS